MTPSRQVCFSLSISAFPPARQHSQRSKLSSAPLLLLQTERTELCGRLHLQGLGKQRFRTSVPRYVPLQRRCLSRGTDRTDTNMKSLSPLTDAVECAMPAAVSAAVAARVDEELMGPKYGFSLEGLMELAGLSVAECVVDVTRHETGTRIGVMCGPGNNGGDGLVCARHLWQFGYRDVHVVYARKKKRFENLVRQIEALEDIKIYEDMTDEGIKNVDVDMWVDCIFGFSFDPDKGAVRQPYNSMIERMNADCARGGACVVAVDIPSGWHVEQGMDRNNGCYLSMPHALISLTAPKLCVQCESVAEMRRKGGGQWVHYIGGRFVPPGLAKALGFEVPQYKGVRQIVRVQ